MTSQINVTEWVTFHNFTNFLFAGGPSTVSRSTLSRIYRFPICRLFYSLQQDNIFTILLPFVCRSLIYIQQDNLFLNLHPFYLQIALQPSVRQHLHDIIAILFVGRSSTFSKTTFSRLYIHFICRQLFHLQQDNIFIILQPFYLQVALPPLARQHFYDFAAVLFAGSSSTFSKTTLL